MNDDDTTSKAASPGLQYAHPILQNDDHVRAVRSSSLPDNVVAASTAVHTTALRRGLGHAAVAGTVVGAVVAAALVALCLYPVIVYQIKRRKRARGPSLDAEAGIHSQHIKASTLRPHSRSHRHRRLSSTDSFTRNGVLSRGGFDGGDPSSAASNVRLTPTEENWDARSRQLSTATEGTACRDVHDAAFDDSYRNETTTPFPYYMPASIPDDNPGVLSGTSHDYYRPSIPSSAFGMVTAADDFAPVPTLSRGSSFKYSLKHMFRRSTGRDSSLASVLCSEQEALNAAQPLAQTILTTPPPSPRPDRAACKAPSSPPSDPALGTVNPMDIMPASTQSEVRHRTEHQLLATSCGPCYGSGPRPSSASDQADMDDVPTTSAPPSAEAAQATHSLTTTNQGALQGALKREHYDVPMLDLHSHDHLTPSVITETSRHPSYSSDHSTPVPGALSTGPSAENTPSTQLDSPSPGSMNSSGFRYSTSPQPGLASPSKVEVLRCDEPGCSQAFDQPHKLRHHQRYHTKDHKCPYHYCGKGFGTKTHLQRHINDRHDKKKKFHCAIPGCDYSKSGGKAFPRKDNWKRHMTKIHNMHQQQLPEPIAIEVDSEMGVA
ncbi:hypothetical protein E4U21_000149 [Claviceps maximensis]|nr:hypothetical protein E4U21_000149 [Claviceps maximensis]